MRKSLVALFILLIASSASAAPELALTVGTGIDARVSRDVNPDYMSTMTFGELYTSVAVHPWSFLGELEYSQNNGGNGNYKVQNSTYTIMTWARYEPWYGLIKVSPFFGAGLGWQFNDTVSHFGGAKDEGWSDGGGIAGLSTGVMTNFYRHWNIEAEMRVAEFEFSTQPAWSFLLRTGYTF